MAKKIKRSPQSRVEPKQVSSLASGYGARLARQVTSQLTGPRAGKKLPRRKIKA